MAPLGWAILHPRRSAAAVSCGKDPAERTRSRDEVELPPVFGDLLDSLPPACRHENLIVTRAGERRAIRSSNTVIRNSGGAAIGAACIGEDITERRSIERAI